MEKITFEQLKKLTEEKTLVTGSTSYKYDHHCGEIVVGIFRKEVDKNYIRYVFQYRIVKEGARNPVQGRKFETTVAYFYPSTGSVHLGELEYWALEPVQSKTLIDAWDAAENRHNTRKVQVKDFKKPFEEIVSEVKENALTLIPEIPLGQADKFIKKGDVIADRKLIRFRYAVARFNAHIGLDSLVSVENFVKEVADRKELSFRASRIGLHLSSSSIVHEFFFD